MYAVTATDASCGLGHRHAVDGHKPRTDARGDLGAAGRWQLARNVRIKSHLGLGNIGVVVATTSA